MSVSSLMRANSTGSNYSRKVLPIWTLSGLISNTLTMRAMKLRMVLKFMRPMLQEPSTSSTMSAFAAVLHWVSAERWRGGGRQWVRQLVRQPRVCEAFSDECVRQSGRKKKVRGSFVGHIRGAGVHHKISQDVYTAECFTEHYVTSNSHW